MTVGITGVFWLPRQAEGNSIALNAGAHAVPIAAAATAWGALSGAWADATTTAARVMCELGEGMVGVNGAAAVARLGGFTAWADQQGVLAAAMGAKAAANATAYTVASLAMPSMPEIAAVDAARVAAHAAGGDLDGSAEAAEAAKVAMDIRAALVMETYEGATSAMVGTPNEFVLPPAIANGADAPAGAQNVEEPFSDGADLDPVTSVVTGVQSLADDAGKLAETATGALQNLGGVASTGFGTVTDAASGVIAAAGPAHSGSPSLMTPLGIGGGVGVATVAGAVATRGVLFNGKGGLSSSSVALPEGWGTTGRSGTAVGEAPSEAVEAAADEAQTPQTMVGPLPARTPGQDEEGEHQSPDYLRDDHFADERAVVDGVIGAAREPAPAGDCQ